MNSKKPVDKDLEKLKFEVTQEIGIQRNGEYKENRKKPKTI